MRNSWVLLLVAMILAACARVVSPSGGPKDTEGPKILASEPLNFSTQFKGNEIYLEFDEFIQNKDFKNQLIVSPPFENDPELKIRGKKATIVLKDSLRPNTTYSFNFGSGITDITEGNAVDSNLFVFSTGDFLDSLEVEGRVENAFDLTSEEGWYVMLYDDLQDSVPTEKRPTYFSKTDGSGNFKIGYVAEGTYQLFVLKDANNNYLFDQPSEAIAFPDTTVDPLRKDTIKLSLFVEEGGDQFVKRAKAEDFDQILIVAARPSENLRMEVTNYSPKQAWYLREPLANGDSVIYWLTNEGLPDTLETIIYDDEEPLDTIKIATKERKEKPKGGFKGGKKPKGVALNSNSRGSFDHFRKLRFTSSVPVKTFPDSVTIREDSIDVRAKVISFGPAKRRFEIDYTFKEETKYELVINPGLFVDYFGRKNDTVKAKFSTRTERDYGRFLIKLQAPDLGHPYVMELMAESGGVVKTDTVETNTETLNYLNLNPGKYRLKLIYDRNGNGKWDTGNYGEKRQPEKVLFYKEEIEVRAGWDLDLSWTVL